MNYKLFESIFAAHTGAVVDQFPKWSESSKHDRRYNEVFVDMHRRMRMRDHLVPWATLWFPTCVPCDFDLAGMTGLVSCFRAKASWVYNANFVLIAPEIHAEE